MTEQQWLRLELFVRSMRQDLLTRAAIAEENRHPDLQRNHLHNAKAAEEILIDIRSEESA